MWELGFGVWDLIAQLRVYQAKERFNEWPSMVSLEGFRGLELSAAKEARF